MIYLPNEVHSPRSHADIQECAQKAKPTGKAVTGIKGESILTEYVDLVISLPID